MHLQDPSWLLRVHNFATEIFQRTMDHMVEDLHGVEVIMDDVPVIIVGDEATHDERLMKFRERA